MTISNNNLTGLTQHPAVPATFAEKLSYAMPKNANPTQYAKNLLQAQCHLVELCDKTLLQGARIIHPPIQNSSDIAAIQNQMTTSGAITFQIPEHNQRAISTNLDSLKQETDKYQESLEKEAKNISSYLLTLPADKRSDAFEKIFNAFMTEANFKGINLLQPETRSQIATVISLRVIEHVTTVEISRLLDEVNSSHDFIQFNEKTTALSNNIADIFKLSNDDAHVLILSHVKIAVENRFGSLETFYHQHQTQVRGLTMANHSNTKNAFENAQKEYANAVENLYNHYDKMIDEATCQTSTDSTKLLVLDVQSLNKQEEKIQKELVTINAKIKIVHSGGHYYNLSRIKQTPEELQQLKATKESELLTINTQKKQKIEEIVKINHTQNLQFNTPDIELLKNKVQDNLVTIKSLNEAEHSLGDKNAKELKNLKALLTVVNTKTPVENQTTSLNKETTRLKASNVHRTWKEWFVEKTIGRSTKKPVHLFDTVKQQITAANGDARLIKEAIRTLYASLDADHKHKFEVEIGKAIGCPSGWFNDKKSAEAGAKHLEAYFNPLPTNTPIDRAILQRVIDSEAGKRAVTAPTSSYSYLKVGVIGLAVLGGAAAYFAPESAAALISSFTK